MKMQQTFTTSMAIFSMLFGAGNLIYPLLVGVTSGSLTWIGMIAFLLSATALPLVGLITMLLFDGDYESFFNRLGSPFGSMSIFICMMIIGPVIAIPRIVTLSHVMISPFLPILNDGSVMSSFLFAAIFLGITFLAAYRENKIIEVLGNIISPLLLTSIIIIVIKGVLTAQTIVPTLHSSNEIFMNNFIRGYETLDLMASVFFASIIITLLKSNNPGALSARQLSRIGLQSGLIGIALLSLVYIGMSILGMYHGHGMQSLGAGVIFREIAFNVLGKNGALIIATAVLMACFSTAIALSAVIAEYLENTISRNHLSYIQALVISISCAFPLCIFGLDYVLALTGGPVVYIVYPALIALTICNLLHKLFNIQTVKIPVALVFIGALIKYMIQ